MPVSRAIPRKLFACAALPASGLFLILAATAPVFASPSPPADLDQIQHARLQVPIFQIASASVSRGSPAVDSSSEAVRPTRDSPLVAEPEKEIQEQALSPASLAETLPANRERDIERPDETAEKWPIVQTHLPGFSGAELQRFKRQMFRRDI